MADHDAKIDDLIPDASSLAAVTGARVAVIAVKPDGEVRQYGCPSVDAVMRSLEEAVDSTERARWRRGITMRIMEEFKDLHSELEVLERLRQRLERAENIDKHSD